MVTGTAFELLKVMQVERLLSHKQPTHEDVNLKMLWSEPLAEVVG